MSCNGVIILFNKKAFQISIVHNEGNALHCRVSHVHSDNSWFILNVYAPSSKRERRVFWTNIIDVIHKSNINKGAIMGYFNSYISDEGKYEGSTLY